MELSVSALQGMMLSFNVSPEFEIDSDITQGSCPTHYRRTEAQCWFVHFFNLFL
jgi:hypothetical protein